MRISVLALDGVFDTGLSVTLDSIRAANNLAVRAMGSKKPLFDVSVVGVRRRVRSGQGFLIPVEPITPALKPDWIVVPAVGAPVPELLLPVLERPDVVQAQAQLLEWNAEGRMRLPPPSRRYSAISVMVLTLEAASRPSS